MFFRFFVEAEMFCAYFCKCKFVSVLVLAIFCCPLSFVVSPYFLLCPVLMACPAWFTYIFSRGIM